MQKVDHANNMQPDKEMTLAEQFEACQKNKHNVIGELAESVIVSLLYDLNFLTTHLPICRSNNGHVNMIL
jgi:hypothetical protein